MRNRRCPIPPRSLALLLAAGFLLHADLGASRPVSAAGGWWRESPGFTDTINRSSVIARDDVWWLTENGALLHWDGVALAKIRLDGKIRATGLWAAGPREIYLAGGAGIWRGDGTRWDQVADFRAAGVEIRGIWGTSSRDVYAFGTQWQGGKALVYRFDGAAWAPFPNGEGEGFTPVWGSSAKDLLGLSSEGRLGRFDGRTWRPVKLAGETAPLRRLWVRSTDDVWAVGDKATLYHADGKAWTAVEHPPWSDVYGIWGAPSGTLHLITGDKLLSFDGSRWQSLAYPSHSMIRSICGASDKEIYIAGAEGALFRTDGRAWSSVGNVTTQVLNGIWGTPGGPVWAVGAGGTLLRREAGTWRAQTPPVRDYFTDVWASSQNDVFVVGGKGGSVLHYDGDAWRQMPSATSEILTRLWGTGPKDVFAGGDGTFLHYDGASWSVMQGDLWKTESVRGIWGASARDVFAVTTDRRGKGGKIFHYDGTAWAVMLQDAALSFSDVWGSGPGDVYAVGRNTFLHFDGKAWTPVAGASGSFASIGGTSARDIYVGGSAVRHFDGVTLAPIEAGEARGIGRLWIDPSGHVYAIGLFGTRGELFRRSAGTLAPPAEVRAVKAAPNRIELAWKASDKATGYNVFRAANEESPWTFAGLTRTTNFSEEVPPGSSYLYRVHAIAARDESEPSSVVRGATAPLTSPSAPAGTVALKPVVPPQPPVKPPEFDTARAEEAAYFGEVRSLRELIDAWPKALREKEGVPDWSNLLKYAMIGRQTEAVRFLLGCAPRYWLAEDLFAPALMDTALARLVLETPGFKETHGQNALQMAVRAGNLDATTVLLEAGVDPNGGDTLLVAPLLVRDIEMLKLLLSKRADPYAPIPGVLERTPVIDLPAIQQSADLLALLDVKHRKAELIEELRRKAPPPGSAFVGYWKDRGGRTSQSLSVESLELFPDGSCRANGGMAPFFWKETGPGAASLTPAPSPIGAAGSARKSMVLTLAQGRLSIVSTDGDASDPLSRAEPRARLDSGWRFPVFTRLEGAWVTPGDKLVVQISGRHAAVPLAALADAAAMSKSDVGIMEQNLLRWAEFTKGAPAASLLEGARLVPIEKRTVSNGYSAQGERLGYDHQHLVSLPGAVEFTLFPGGGAEYYREPGSQASAEPVQSFFLMAAKPFAHGRDWLQFFFLRSKENR